MFYVGMLIHQIAVVQPTRPLLFVKNAQGSSFRKERLFFRKKMNFLLFKVIYP